jgi:pyridoxal phosphate enzyme (YggS family)
MTDEGREVARESVGSGRTSPPSESDVAAHRELEERLARVRQNIAQAARRVGRSPDAVSLVAVSKTVSAERVAAAARLGLHRFGENRVQEADAKLAALRTILSVEEWSALTWHLIGHLQTNKARLASRLFSTIESVDSTRLAIALGRLGVERDAPVPVLLEVNVGREPSKFGFLPEDLLAEIRAIRAIPGLEARGLMTVAPIVPEPEAARPYFRALCELRDRLIGENPGVALPELSMGMTDDYPVAIEEGATIVRVGRAIFGERAG